MGAAPESSKSLMYEQLQRNQCRALCADESVLQAPRPPSVASESASTLDAKVPAWGRRPGLWP
jgi:hypothetical protein